MSDRMEEAWTEYQFGKMIDPVHRYEHDDKAIFAAGWKASQRRKHPAGKQSIWVSAPAEPIDNPEIWIPS
jgi:hypothetical protein